MMEKDKWTFLIDEALKKEPEFRLEEGFEDRVLKKMRQRESKKQWKLYVFMAVAMVMMLGYGLSSLTAIVDFNASLVNNISQFVPLAAMIGCLVVVVQWIDNKLIKDRVLKRMA